jgi:TorA maturation chaperone TorD
MNPAVLALLRDAAEWRLLSVLFEYPGEGWRERLTSIVQDVHDERLKQASDAALIQASPGMHHSIFGPGGPVSPREASYTNGVQLGYLLSEISAFHDAFGYTPESVEPADHISVQAGFIAYLRLKQAYALTCGEDDKASITAEATSDFIREHLARMATPIAAALEPVAPEYLVVAGLALAERSGPARPELATFWSSGTDDEQSLCETGCG